MENKNTETENVSIKNEDTIILKEEVEAVLSWIDYKWDYSDIITEKIWEDCTNSWEEDEFSYYENFWKWEVKLEMLNVMKEKVEDYFPNIEQVDIWEELIEIEDYIKEKYEIEIDW